MRQENAATTESLEERMKRHNAALRQRLFHGGRRMTALNASLHERNSSRSEAPLLGGAGDDEGGGLFLVAALLGVGVLRWYCQAKGNDSNRINRPSSGTGTAAAPSAPRQSAVPPTPTDSPSSGDEFAEIYNEENICAKGCLIDSSGNKFMVKIMRNEAGTAYVIYLKDSDRPMIEIATRADGSLVRHGELDFDQLMLIADSIIKVGGETTQNLSSAVGQLKSTDSDGSNSEYETLLLQVVREIIIISNPINEITRTSFEKDLLLDKTDNETRSSLQM